MPFRIYDWNEIKHNYKDTLLLGNGASRSVDDRFGYESLVEHARKNGLITQDIEQLFNFFKTYDFELILRLVWQASNVNRSLNISDTRTHAAYVHVRECLIQAVRDVHPEYYVIARHIPVIYGFVRNFKMILSLNYDLILYWSIMHGVDHGDNYSVKDCFNKRAFYGDWRRFRTPIGRNTFATLAFYPHGNLALSRNNVESEFKIPGNSNGLLEAILEAWRTEQCTPLFVSEGTQEQKINSIQNSSYLNTVYREVLTSLGPNLAIYGWGFGNQDRHILDRIALSGIRRVAVSVHGHDQSYCYKVCEIIYQALGPQTQIEFFHSNSPGCWNHAT